MTTPTIQYSPIYGAPDHHGRAIWPAMVARRRRHSRFLGLEQVQTAVDCYNAAPPCCTSMCAIRRPGRVRSDFEQYNYFIGLLRKAVPKMILQVGGSISFSPKTDDAKAKWLNYDTRHMLTELDPKPDCVTVAVGTGQWDIISMMHKEDVEGDSPCRSQSAGRMGRHGRRRNPGLLPRTSQEAPAA